MNAIQEINRINQRELELGVAGKGSWHDQYKDSAYVFIGGLPYDLTEGDVITVFSQFGEVMDINMPRDKETGKVRGFGFLMYEDQRSTVLAVDNLNGSTILGRTIRVDHCRKYKQKGEKNEDGKYMEPEEPTYNAMPPTIEGSDDSESSESEAAADSLDEEDPMAAFIRSEKKKSKSKAITDGKKDKKRKHEGETKEERRARKEAKRAKRAAKEAKKLGKAGVKVESGLRLKEEERERNRDRERGRAGGSETDRYADRDRDRDSHRDERGRANRDDWREGRWELERDERERERDRYRDSTGDRDRRDDRRARDDRDRLERHERSGGRYSGDGYDDRDRRDRRDRDRDERDARRDRDGRYRDDRDARRRDGPMNGHDR